MRAITIGLAIFALLVPVSQASNVPVHGIEYDNKWAGLLHALDVLETGSRAEKLAALSPDTEGAPVFMWIDGGDMSATRAVVDRLRDYVRSENDTWVLDRVVASLADEMLEQTTPVFLDLLSHPAPSVRARAMRFLADGDSALEEQDVTRVLEDMWRAERRPWLRAELLDELEDTDSELHVETCPKLAWDDDVALAEAAIDCTAAYPAPDRLELLVRRAKSGNPVLRVAALNALRWQDREGLAPLVSAIERMAASKPATWLAAPLLEVLDAAGSDAAVSYARAWLWSDDQDLAQDAIHVLANHAGDENRGLLVRRFRQAGAPLVRAAALRALDAPQLGGEVERIVLDALRAGESELVRRTAIDVLGGVQVVMQDPGSIQAVTENRARYLPQLRAIAERDPDEGTRAAAASLIGSLEGKEMHEIACGGAFAPDRVVVAEDSATSVRCHVGPGIEPPVALARRLPVGMGVDEEDRFDDGTSIWISIDDSCWLPAENVRRVQPDDPGVGPGGTPDFDMRIEATLKDSFRALEEHGILETFDRGETLVGVRLRVEPEDDEGLALLRQADEWAATPIGVAVRAFLPAVIDRTGSRDGWDGWWRSPE